MPYTSARWGFASGPEGRYTPRTVTSLEASDVVLTFLESVGRRSEAELYLELFRKLPKSSFAVIASEASVTRHARRSLVEQLSFLHQLGLVAPLVLGLFDPGRSTSARAALLATLRQAGLPASEHEADDEDLAAAVRDQLLAGQLPVISFRPQQTEAERFQILDSLLEQLDSRKLVVLRDRGGVGPHGLKRVPLGNDHSLPSHHGGISVINLQSDLKALLDSGVLSSAEEALLRRLAPLAEAHVKLQVSVASPLVLFKELFTVRGAGTLIKRGAVISRHAGYADLDQGALLALLESAFQKRLLPGFFERPPLAVFLEQHYRGAAIVEQGAGAAFLTKFVVGPVAQGEGIGRDLWEALKRDQPRFYWRAKPGNAIATWYADNCDGLVRLGDWTVYWRGVAAADIPRIVEDALGRAEDFGQPGQRES